MNGRIYQINIKPETLGERGLPKRPVNSVEVTFHGLDGDFNRYRQEKCNGRFDKAVLLMPLEMIAQLNNEGWPINPGDIGENIISQGIAYDNFSPNKRYRFGEVEIMVTEPCIPCGNLKILPYVGKEKWTEFKKAMIGRRGWYAQVLKEGRIKVGDEIIFI